MDKFPFSAHRFRKKRGCLKDREVNFFRKLRLSLVLKSHGLNFSKQKFPSQSKISFDVLLQLENSEAKMMMA